MKRFLPLLIVLPEITLADDSIPEQLLVTGSYTPVSVEQIPSFVSVLDYEAIQALNKRSVTALLRTVPGVLIEEQGGPGGLSAVSIRGGESNFTVVMLDGVQVNDPNNSRGGSFDFSKLDVDGIERIEVVRGPQSAVYGSDALAGVINIISRQATEQHRQSLSAEWGEEDYRSGHISLTGTVSDVGYTLQMGRRDEGEPVPGSTLESDELALGLAWKLSTQHVFKVNYRYLDGERTSYPEQSGGPEFAAMDALDDTQYTDQSLALAWDYRIFDRWNSHLSFSWLELEEDFSSPGIAPFDKVPPYYTNSDFNRSHWQWVNTLGTVGEYWLNAGADLKQEDGESKGVLASVLETDFELDRDIAGVFVDASGQINEQILLQASIRYDDPDGFSSETSSKIGARYQPVDRITLRANWGEGFKLPSFFALGHGLVGNPDLKPETTESWDVGIDWQPVDRLQLGLGYFDNDYRDLIDFDPNTFTNVNRSQVETSGVELQLQWQLLDSLQLAAHGTHTDINVMGSDAKLTGRPEWQAGALLNWQISPDWQTALDYQWQDERYSTSLYTGSSVTQSLDDYHRVDFSLQWQVMEPLQLQMAVDNLLDEDYETSVGFPSAGRLLRLGFRLTH